MSAVGSRGKGIACIVASAFGFAVMAACVRLCDDCGGAVSSFQKSFFRNVVAFFIALGVYLKGCAEEGRSAWRLQIGEGALKPWLLLLLRSALGTVGIFANFYALGHIDIAESQTLNKTAPFFTVVFAWAFLGERAGWRTLGPLAFAFSGVLLIAKPGFAGEAGFPLAIALLGGVCAGAAYAALRALGKTRMPSAFVILFFSAFSCLASIPFMICEFDPMTPTQLLVLLGAGAGAALGQFGVTLAYRMAAPRDIAVFDYSNIVFTAALGFALFGQVPDAFSAAGFALVLLAAWMMRAHRHDAG